MTKISDTPLRRRVAALAGLALLWAAPLAADPDCDEQCQLARKAQDPLASIRALITDSTVALDKERDPASIGTQLQPVYSLPTEGNFNVILRGIVPVLAVRDGLVLPRLGDEPRGGSSYESGVSDLVLQSFISPKTGGNLKFGIGPQVSLKTRSSRAVAGPGWGAGISAVVTGFSGPVTYGMIAGQHWGEEGYSVATINPVLMYNAPVFGGSYVGYANSMSYNWKAESGDRWQIPLGLTAGKTFGLKSGAAIDFSLGAYRMVKRPQDGAEGQIKIGLSLILP